MLRKGAHPLCTILKWQLGWEDLTCAQRSQTLDGDGGQSHPLPRPFVGEGSSVSQFSPMLTTLPCLHPD